MQIFFQQLVDGLASGVIYASLALALVLIYRSTNIVNFAQGDMAMFSTYIAWGLTTKGWSPWLAALACVAVSFVGGAAIYTVAIRPLKGDSILAVVIVTLGLLLAVNSLAGYIWDYEIRSVESIFPLDFWQVGGVTITAQSIGNVVVLAGVVVLLFLLFQKTKIGLGMRAAAANPESSRLVGISVRQMLLLGWGLAALLGALSGVLVAPKLFLEPNMMLAVQIYAFASATLGGFDSPVGAVVGGLIVGVAENMAGTYIDWIGNDLKIMVPLLIIFAVLLVRPAGLFGRPQLSRV